MCYFRTRPCLWHSNRDIFQTTYSTMVSSELGIFKALSRDTWSICITHCPKPSHAPSQAHTYFDVFLTVHHSMYLSKYQLSAHSLNIQQYKLHYTPQHVSSSTLLIIRRTNCITTASGIVTLHKQPYSMRVESSPPAYCTAAYRGWRYQRLWWYNWSSWWWAACCSKHVEECNVTYIVEC